MVDAISFRHRHGRLPTLILLLAGTLIHPLVAHAQDAAESFSAFAVDMTPSAGGRPARMEIVVDRWATEADRRALVDADADSGILGVATMLREGPRTGFVRLAGRIGNDVTFARQVRHLDGTRRILIVLARYLGFTEVVTDSPTGDYPFTVIELFMMPTGSGRGTVSVGTKVKFHRNDDLIDTDKYVGGRIVLNDVKARAR